MRTLLAGLLSALLLLAGSSGSGAPAARQTAPAPRDSRSEPAYVLFQLHVEDEAPENREIPRLVEEIRKEFGAHPAGHARHVGFTPGLLFALNLPEDVLTSRVRQALDLAERNGIPVFFHLDDMHFWFKRPDLFRDPEAVEWSAFPRPGESHGPIAPRYWLNWGGWVVSPAPPPCFECPKFRADVTRRLTRCIAIPIVERLDRWRREGREHLFAGIAVGNETQISDYRSLAMLPPGQEPEGIDQTRIPPVKVRMRRDEMVRTGYASLHRRGHTGESIARTARERGVTVEQVTTDLLYDVAHDYAEFRARTLVEAGLPRERLYTHFTSPFRPFLEGEVAKAQMSGVETAGAGLLPPPARHAVNPYSRPGFTVARDMVDLPRLAREIAPAGGGAVEWGAVETYVTTGQPGRAQTREEYAAYLRSLFAGGARVVNVYGWNIPGASPYSVRNAAGVVRAVKEWVSGQDLPAPPNGPRSDQIPTDAVAPPQGTVPPPAFREKLERLDRAIRRWQREGRDLAPVGAILRDLEPLLQGGRLGEAETLLDRALDRLRESP